MIEIEAFNNNRGTRQITNANDGTYVIDIEEEQNHGWG